MCPPATRISSVESDKPFRILVSSSSDQPLYLLPQQVVAIASRQPENPVESHILHAQIFGLVPDDRDMKVRQCHIDVCGIDKINKHITDQREQHVGKD